MTAEFGVGIGIALAPNDGIVAEELVRRADRALYRAKAAGRSSVCFFELEMDARVERRMQIERELKSATAADVKAFAGKYLVRQNRTSIYRMPEVKK